MSWVGTTMSGAMPAGSLIWPASSVSVSAVGVAQSGYGSSSASRLSERYVRLASHQKGCRSSGKYQNKAWQFVGEKI